MNDDRAKLRFNSENDDRPKLNGEDLAEELPHIRRYARSLTRSEADGDDLMQTAMEHALRSRHQFLTGTRLRRWLFTIVRNAHIDELRKRSRWRSITVHETFEPSCAPSQDLDLELRDVGQAYERLRPEEKKVLRLSVFDGLPHGEIAERLGVAVGTVKSRLFRARQSLAEGH